MLMTMAMMMMMAMMMIMNDEDDLDDNDDDHGHHVHDDPFLILWAYRFHPLPCVPGADLPKQQHHYV